MTTMHFRFVEPLDVLFLRGNKLFGDPGSHGDSLVPPWPSVAAGAIRSRLLADDGIDLAQYANNKVVHPTLGTPAEPGSFALTGFQLARRLANGRIEAIYTLPADLVVSEADGTIQVRSLTPTTLAPGLQSSGVLPSLLHPVLAEHTRGKPAGGYWLLESGWRKYLSGQLPDRTDLIASRHLWAIDPRVGIGLDPATGRADDGKLFSTQAVVMAQRDPSKAESFDVGFLLSVRGAALPDAAMLRLGGDGRGALLQAATVNPAEPDWKAIAQNRRCRLILTTPGLFASGWLPNGCSGDRHFKLAGVAGRLVCATVSRAETVSGWDLARWQPKPAQRTAPTGSVYWLNDLDATPEDLHKLVNQGLWSDVCEDSLRRAEGFNRIALAAW